MKEDTIRCVIVDDEPIARHGLRSYVDKVEWLECVAMPDNAMALDTYLNDVKGTDRRPDLIFIDIEMPGVSGLDYLATHKVDAAVIVVTAYAQYAVRGYELNITDYLLKPVSLTRFMKAIEKARQFIAMRNGIKMPECLFIKSDRRIHRIEINDIEWLEALENYVIIHTSDQRIITRATLRSLMQSLPSDRFIQVHKSHVINILRMHSLEGNTLRMLSGGEVTVSRNMRITLTDLMK